MRFGTASLLASLLLATPATAAVFNPVTRTLPNGLEVVVVENHRAPVVLQMLWYHTGAADEPEDGAGLAHYIEHMMFKGTIAHPDMDFSAAVASLGGEDNAFTSYDYTAFYQKVPPAQLDQVMQMEAERMTGLKVDPQKAATERSVIQQERGQRNESTPEAKFSLKLQEALYQGHPYGRAVIGTKDSIDKLSAEQIATYYHARYAPNNATLIIVGDVAAADAIALAEKNYGGAPRRQLPARARPAIERKAPQQLTVREAQVRQPVLALAWLAPNYSAPGALNPYAFDLLENILNSPNGALAQQLIYQRGIAVDAEVSYDGNKLNEGDFTLTLSPRPDVLIDTAEAKLQKTLQTIQQKGISAAELADAKRRLIESATLARDTLTSAAYAFGTARTTGESIDDVESWPDRVEAVKLEEVNAALATLRQPADVTARLVGDK